MVDDISIKIVVNNVSFFLQFIFSFIASLIDKIVYFGVFCVCFARYGCDRCGRFPKDGARRHTIRDIIILFLSHFRCSDEISSTESCDLMRLKCLIWSFIKIQVYVCYLKTRYALNEGSIAVGGHCISYAIFYPLRMNKNVYFNWKPVFCI